MRARSGSGGRTRLPSVSNMTALDILVFDPTACAVECHAVTFARVVSGQLVIGADAILIFDQRMHRVLDVNLQAEHAFVPEIAIMCLIVGIERAQMIACRQRETKAASIKGRTG